jgi:hypothetical protein
MRTIHDAAIAKSAAMNTINRREGMSQIPLQIRTTTTARIVNLQVNQAQSTKQKQSENVRWPP